MITKLKKDPTGYEALTKEFFEVTKEKGCNEALCKYVWNGLIALNKGYGFQQHGTPIQQYIVKKSLILSKTGLIQQWFLLI